MLSVPRFNVDFSPEALAVLDDLASRASTTKAEVLRRAIALEKWFITTTDRGGKIIVRNPDGTEQELLRV